MTRAESTLSKHMSADKMFWISSNSPSEIEVNVTHPDGTTDRDATDTLAIVADDILGWGGFKTGYGSWILRRNYARARYNR